MTAEEEAIGKTGMHVLKDQNFIDDGEDLEITADQR